MSRSWRYCNATPTRDDDGEDIFEKVFDDGEDIFEKVFDDNEDIFEEPFPAQQNADCPKNIEYF